MVLCVILEFFSLRDFKLFLVVRNLSVIISLSLGFKGCLYLLN